MRKGIFLVIVLIVYVTVFIQIHSIAVEIDQSNEHSTYQLTTPGNTDYATVFMNYYKDTIIKEKYEVGFNMLDDETKKMYNSNLEEYTKAVKEIHVTINKYLKDKTTTNINLKNVTYNDGKATIDYEIISMLWNYLEELNLYYYKEYSWFENLTLIEYLPKKYKISFKDIEKEGSEWDIKI